MEDLDQSVLMSAQTITGRTHVDEDGTESFVLDDGEEQVEVSHEVGDPDTAARALDALAKALTLHAERIRGRNRAEVSWT